MTSLTLGAAKAIIARVEGVCRDSAKVKDLLNEAEQRLLNRPDKPVGALVQVQFCINNQGCITWPRQIQTIEQYAVCGTPGTVRPQWFNYIGYPNGVGVLGPNSCPGNMLIDNGMACAFEDVISNQTYPRRIAAIASHVSDIGKKITLRYLDSNGQRVYTEIDGVVQEGEVLTLVNPPTPVYTSKNVGTGGLYHVIKETTNYPIWLYECDSSVASPYPLTKMLAHYEPSEELPIYRRSMIPGISQSTTDSDPEACTETRTLTALVKLQHVPVVVDNDPFVIGNIAALKLMVMAIMREEQNRLEESAVLEGKARAEIDGELSSYLGDGMVTAIRTENGDVWGAGYPSLRYAWNVWQ